MKLIRQKINFKALIGFENLEEQIEIFNLAFLIPEFQRGYSWKSDQLDEMFDDLKKAYYNSDKIGFSSLGVFYLFQDNQNDKFEIIDGQQRFTTILIILEAIKSCLTNENHKHSLYDKNGNRIINGFSKDSILEKSYIEFFDNYINEIRVCNEDFANEDVTFKGMKAIYDDFSIKFSTEFEETEERINFYRFILEDLHFWPYIEQDEEVKIDLFMKLNSRGRQLSFTTLLKSFLYSIDDLEMSDVSGENRKTLTIAKFYENDIESEIIKNQIKSLSTIDKKEKKILEGCSHFFYLEGRKFLDEFKNLEDPMSQTKTLFNAYVKYFRHIFSEVKSYKNHDEAVIFIKNQMTFFRSFLIKYMKICVRYENEIVLKLADILIFKYNPIIAWLNLKADLNEIDKNDVQEFSELIFLYLFSRRLKWYVDNKLQLTNKTKTDQLNPRNLRYFDFYKVLIDRSVSIPNKKKELKSYLTPEIKSDLQKFFDKSLTKVWQSATNFSKTETHIDYYKELLDKYEIYQDIEIINFS